MNRQQRRQLERQKKGKKHHNIDEADNDEYFAGEVSMDIQVYSKSQWIYQVSLKNQSKLF